MKNVYFCEMTDLFCGDANYSYVRRFKVTASSERGCIGKIARDSGLNFRKEYEGCYHSTSKLTVVFIEDFDEDFHGQYEVTEL